MNKKLLTTSVPPQWMVLARHFGMPGGVLDYGEASIKNFFDNRKDAEEYAEKLLRETHEGLIEPMIWVLKCEKTYQRAREGLCVAVSNI